MYRCCYYYLHTNGDVIFKTYDARRVSDFVESPFVRCFWMLDVGDRALAWDIVIEAEALGANPERVDALAAKWGTTSADADEYASRAGIVFARGRDWTARPAAGEGEVPEGVGDSKRAAMVALAKALGLTDGKVDRRGFRELLAGFRDVQLT